MRGDDRQQGAMFSYVSPEQRVPADHPLRPIREMVDEVLQELSPRFDRMYAQMGRPSIAPEKLLRALLLQILYSIRSERMLMEQLDYNLLFRWFMGLNLDDAVWVPTVFSKNRDRLLEGDVAHAFFAAVLGKIRQRGWVSDEHFSVDGTLLEAWASQKSFQKKDGEGGATAGDDPGNPTVDFHGEKRSNQTHQSRTDPEALLAKKGKGKEAKLCYAGHVLIENRNGFVVNTVLTQAYGRAEPERGLVDGGEDFWNAAGERGSRQGVRPGRRGAGVAPDEGHAARGPETAQCCGPSDHPAGGLSDQPAGSQTGGRSFRLDENDRVVAEATASRSGPGRLDVHLYSGRLQFGPGEESERASSTDIGRCVSVGEKQPRAGLPESGKTLMAQ